MDRKKYTFVIGERANRKLKPLVEEEPDVDEEQAAEDSELADSIDETINDMLVACDDAIHDLEVLKDFAMDAGRDGIHETDKEFLDRVREMEVPEVEELSNFIATVEQAATEIRNLQG